VIFNTLHHLFFIEAQSHPKTKNQALRTENQDPTG